MTNEADIAPGVLELIKFIACLYIGNPELYDGEPPNDTRAHKAQDAYNDNGTIGVRRYLEVLEVAESRLVTQIRQVAKELSHIKRRSESPIKLLSSDDILTREWPEPNWAIPQLLPSGLGILAGKPKLGKSWLALQISKAIAEGGHVLGHKVESGPVLYLALEDPPKRLAARMKNQGWGRGLPADFMVLGEFTEKIGDLRTEGGERLARQIEYMNYRFAVIDTLSRSVFGDQNDVDRMTAGLTPIQEIAHAQNTAVMLIDHHSKGFGRNPDAVADILGSTAKGAMADSIWGLYREPGKAGAKLVVTGRDIVEQTLALTWDQENCIWIAEGIADDIEITQNRQDILDALRDMGPSTNQEVADAVGRNKGSVYRDLQDLVNAQKVQVVSGEYGLPVE